jgi:hypothetical protein
MFGPTIKNYPPNFQAIFCPSLNSPYDQSHHTSYLLISLPHSNLREVLSFQLVLEGLKSVLVRDRVRHDYAHRTFVLNSFESLLACGATDLEPNFLFST